MKATLTGFEKYALGADCALWVGQLPDTLIPSSSDFEALWQIHPGEYHEIMMHGRLVKTPRWQQAFGMDYHYTGNVNKALPIPSILEAFHRWARGNADNALNGLLINWYAGHLGHYIGRHRDSIHNLVPTAPIVTISLGEERTFRLRPWPAQAQAKPIDFPARNGTVFVMPWETNCAFTHEVPHSTRKVGRRISITLRAFTKMDPNAGTT